MVVINQLDYNYLQLLCREMIEFSLSEDSQDQFGLQNISSDVANDILQDKLVEGARGEVRILISQKKLLYRILEYQVNDGKKFAILQ